MQEEPQDYAPAPRSQAKRSKEERDARLIISKYTEATFAEQSRTAHLAGFGNDQSLASLEAVRKLAYETRGEATQRAAMQRNRKQHNQQARSVVWFANEHLRATMWRTSDIDDEQNQPATSSSFAQRLIMNMSEERYRALPRNSRQQQRDAKVEDDAKMTYAAGLGNGCRHPEPGHVAVGAAKTARVSSGAGSTLYREHILAEPEQRLKPPPSPSATESTHATYGKPCWSSTASHPTARRPVHMVVGRGARRAEAEVAAARRARAEQVHVLAL